MEPCKCSVALNFKLRRLFYQPSREDRLSLFTFVYPDKLKTLSRPGNLGRGDLLERGHRDGRHQQKQEADGDEAVRDSNPEPAEGKDF